jgi:hypothetical protein
MGRSLAFLIPFVSLIAGVVSGGQAAETVWSGLVIAENVAQPQAVPPELTRIEGSLKKFFGYNQFQVIGQSQKTLKIGLRPANFSDCTWMHRVKARLAMF